MEKAASYTLAEHLANLENEIAEIFEDDIKPKEPLLAQVVIAEEPIISRDPAKWNPCECFLVVVLTSQRLGL
jgi:hypothetical protein